MPAWLENYAQEHGIGKIRCSVRKSVPRNIQLYLSAGYSVSCEKTVQSSSGLPVDIVIMEKDITRAG